jgi:hypothetical protein
MKENNDELLEALVSLGCKAENLEGTTLVTPPGDYGEFVYEMQGGWLYIGATFMAPEDFEGTDHEATLNRFLLELHDRNLGCHFSYDRAGFLSIGSELYPNQRTPDDVLQIMEQIAYVVDVCIALCDHILDSGEIPADREVDEAFGVNEQLH